jgi:hypothetical protein
MEPVHIPGTPINMNQTRHTKESSLHSVLKKIYLLLIFIFLALISLSPANGARELTGNELINALKQGGHSIYFRHEATDWSQQDNVYKKDDWLSCNPRQMRQLSDTGRQNAKHTGEILQKLGIPVNQIIASPYCRTVETARLMNLGTVNPSNKVINMYVAGYFGGRQVIINSTRALLSLPTTKGFNRVIVSHGNVAQSATPVYPDEGEGVVFKADGNGGFDYVGRFTSEQWSRPFQTSVQ